MTKLEALEALKAKVEAGSSDGVDAIVRRMASDARNTGEIFPALDVQKAYHGSLDAAMALHNAVLPGWVKWDASHSAFGYEMSLTNGPLDAAGCSTDNPARAWLIAILSALIKQEKANAAQDPASPMRP